jgi:ADP-ribose pyrophosphatase YjhB (NUDIX family)
MTDRPPRKPSDFPHPPVAVDTAVLTVEPDGSPAGRLAVLLIRRDTTHHRGAWSLPGTFLHEGELLAEAVDRALRTKAGVSGRKPAQLRVFDALDRDDRERVLSVAHVDVIRHDELVPALGSDVTLAPARRLGPLPYDHREIVAAAVADTERRYTERPDPGHLLGRQFTMRELRQTHEAVLARRLQKDTFRRAMESYLIATGTLTEGGLGRPAELFRRAG